MAGNPHKTGQIAMVLVAAQITKHHAGSIFPVRIFCLMIPGDPVVIPGSLQGHYITPTQAMHCYEGNSSKLSFICIVGFPQNEGFK